MKEELMKSWRYEKWQVFEALNKVVCNLQKQQWIKNSAGERRLLLIYQRNWMFVLTRSTRRAQTVNFKNTISYKQEAGFLREMVGSRFEAEYVQDESCCAT